ncbi:MAG: class D sortase [Anaerolineae bacterium]|nr:class D sortase [Anaerolineae bacterium]
MKDHRYVDELTVEELEEALRVRRRQERLKRLGAKNPQFDPLRATPAVTAGIAPERSRQGDDLPRYSAVVESGRKRVWRPIRWRWIWDKLLLLVEIVALLGFVLLVMQLFTTVQKVNEDSRVEFATPTGAPTPMIGLVGILPGGHTPPDADRHSEPAPIPVHLRSLVEAITPMPAPTPGPEQAQRIVITSLNVDAPVVEGDDWEALKKGAGHHIGSANPGERGNCVISAHNDIYGEIFRDLPDMKVGDEISVHTQTQHYRYVVEQTRIIRPEEVSVMAPTSTPVLTLISCYPYGVDSHRIVVIATLQP